MIEIKFYNCCILLTICNYFLSRNLLKTSPTMFLLSKIITLRAGISPKLNSSTDVYQNSKKIKKNKEKPVQQKKSLLISSNHAKALINQFDADIFKYELIFIKYANMSNEFRNAKKVYFLPIRDSL